MKNTRALLMILVSLLLGLAAVVFASQWINDQTRISTATVLVAIRDINAGTRLNEDMLKKAAWPSSNTPTGSFQDTALLQNRVLKAHLVTGEPVLESKLAPVGTSGGLSGVIAEGKRAITVRVNDVIGVAGFALPGNLVDILVNAQDENRKPFSKIVLEQILVLAVAQDVGRDDTKPKVVTAVTLEVLPEEAETLDLARSIGTLSLALRNQVDSDHNDTKGRRIADLLKQPIVSAEPSEQKIVRRSTKNPQSVAIIRGLHQTEMKLTEGKER
ncbi:MAG: Flp pilus assembly protein CpaB [Nitrosomonas sp.]|jgi:pilus assembly protein CpaB|uniref:Flp pilus assembly protein CpaB n=1 Tax=Nitrosomonas sp. TaxID=42353 RepID=UPI002730865D|nr:Flp pilus assembly protein CpaB [Nitrosomonas sp.]MDP1549297.1 Flp pilus assembly protein CpaB [Nitrosomonas sp.]